MSNENTSKPQLTRIPLDQVWFMADTDFPGGNAMASSIPFGPPKIKGRQHFLGYFVPSYQIVEIEYYPHDGANAEPEQFAVPMSAVKKLKRSRKA